MPASPRLIRRRLKSTRSTRKIMKAMELVAGSKMRKTTQLAVSARPYARLIEETLERLEHEIRPAHPFFAGRGSTDPKILLVVIASDRGLCAGFNVQLLKKAAAFVKTRRSSASTEPIRLVTVGRRAEAIVKLSRGELLAAFPAISNAPSFERATALTDFIRQEYLSGRIDEVHLAYTHFKSALIQTPSVTRLLPVSNQPWQAAHDAAGRTHAGRMLFEPDPERVLQALLERAVDLRIYSALLESAASEHSARMMAMRSAGDAAAEMLETLTFNLNQARQSAITREISEISAGKAAVE